MGNCAKRVLSAAGISAHFWYLPSPISARWLAAAGQVPAVLPGLYPAWPSASSHSNAFLYITSLIFVCFPSSLPLLSANSVPSAVSHMQQAPFLGLSMLISHCIVPETLAKCFLWRAGGYCCTKTADYPAVRSMAAWLAPHQVGRGDGALHITPHMHNIGIYPHPGKAKRAYSSHDYTYTVLLSQSRRQKARQQSCV